MVSFYLALIDDAEGKALFTEFYHRYEKKVYAVAIRILKNHSLAEEAVSETFFTVARHFERFTDIYQRNRQEIGPWAVTIAKNVSLKLLKKELREIPLPEEWDPPAAEGVESQSGYHRLVELILALPIPYRQVLELKFVQEETSQEIARQLGISVAAVEKRVERGRRMLKEALRKEGYGDD